ncbi:hypothetical protein PCE1_003151 [Barthelona sp. PCE]
MSFRPGLESLHEKIHIMEPNLDIIHSSLKKAVRREKKQQQTFDEALPDGEIATNHFPFQTNSRKGVIQKSSSRRKLVRRPTPEQKTPIKEVENPDQGKSQSFSFTPTTRFEHEEELRKKRTPAKMRSELRASFKQRQQRNRELNNIEVQLPEASMKKLAEVEEQKREAAKIELEEKLKKEKAEAEKEKEIQKNLSSLQEKIKEIREEDLKRQKLRKKMLRKRERERLKEENARTSDDLLSGSILDSISLTQPILEDKEVLEINFMPNEAGTPDNVILPSKLPMDLDFLEKELELTPQSSSVNVSPHSYNFSQTSRFSLNPEAGSLSPPAVDFDGKLLMSPTGSDTGDILVETIETHSETPSVEDLITPEVREALDFTTRGCMVTKWTTKFKLRRRYLVFIPERCQIAWAKRRTSSEWRAETVTSCVDGSNNLDLENEERCITMMLVDKGRQLTIRFDSIEEKMQWKTAIYALFKSLERLG